MADTSAWEGSEDPSRGADPTIKNIKLVSHKMDQQQRPETGFENAIVRLSRPPAIEYPQTCSRQTGKTDEESMLIR